MVTIAEIVARAVVDDVANLLHGVPSFYPPIPIRLRAESHQTNEEVCQIDKWMAERESAQLFPVE
jgi:hypothetical protein